MSALTTENAQQATEIAKQATMISHLATRGPAVVTPIVSVGPTPYQPVIGSVEIEQGRCCVGGIAGDTLQIQVAFDASSPHGEVTQMRTRAGALQFTERQMEEAEWEAFEPFKAFPVSVALNWVGYYVSVQFQDEQGNLSPVYYDDISVEGLPPSPTPNP